MTVSPINSINSDISNLKNDCIKFNGDLVADLSLDIMLHITPFLGVADLGHMACVSKRWKQIFEMDELWTLVARSLGIDLPLESPSIKRQVKLFHLSSLYTRELIEALGGLEAFSKIPILDLGGQAASVSNMVIKENEVSAPFMRGVDLYKKPFLTVRYINRQRRKPREEFELLIRVNLQNQVCWQTANVKKGTGLSPLNKPRVNRLTKLLKEPRPPVIAMVPYSQKIEYIRRLVKGENCGIYNLSSGKEEALITNGQSTVQLAKVK